MMGWFEYVAMGVFMAAWTGLIVWSFLSKKPPTDMWNP